MELIGAGSSPSLLDISPVSGFEALVIYYFILIHNNLAGGWTGVVPLRRHFGSEINQVPGAEFVNSIIHSHLELSTKQVSYFVTFMRKKMSGNFGFRRDFDYVGLGLGIKIQWN